MLIYSPDLIGIMNKASKRLKEASFGKRMAQIRKARGITQAELSKRIGVSRRMVVYYESQSDFIPGEHLSSIAKALKVSTDELLGLKGLALKDSGESMRLMNKLRMISQLPPRQRKAVIDYADALLSKQNNSH
jgi:transcriptional regulator with XRE-family HTH domain